MRRVKTELPAAPAERYAAARVLAERASLPARSEPFWFGTANWSDPALSQDALFYPSLVKTPESRLRHYAEHFRVLEVDATYYALLSADVVGRWAQWTPDDFRFSVKAHPVFSGHPIDRKRLPKELDLALPAASDARLYPKDLPPTVAREIEQRYFAGLAPLIESGRLAAILVQFPPWFDATRGNARHIEGLRRRFPEAPFAIEFRHRSWLLPERRERVFALLRALELVYVAVDEPVVERAGVPLAPVVTCQRLAILRCHGQNHAAWANPRASIAERFNYLYAPAELLVLAGALERMSQEAAEVHTVFSNCIRDYALLGAKGLCGLMADSFARRGT